MRMAEGGVQQLSSARHPLAQSSLSSECVCCAVCCVFIAQLAAIAACGRAAAADS